jgi:PhnB protein
MLVQAYLTYNGRCEEAVEFYKSALGAEVLMLMRNKDNPEPSPEHEVPGTENKVLHCSFRIGETVVMASDGMNTADTAFNNFALSISVDSEAEADRVFNALGAGGQVFMPLARTFWSPRFGMVGDKFGVMWMVGLGGDPPPAG